MNTRQARFVREYLLDRNGAGAAVRAGYSPRTAKQIAHELLTRPDLAAAVREGEAQLAAKVDVDREKALNGLLEAVEMARARGDPGAMIRAWSEIARMCGFYAPERVLKVGVNVTLERAIADLETRSDAELMALVTDSGATT